MFQRLALQTAAGKCRIECTQPGKKRTCYIAAEGGHMFTPRRSEARIFNSEQEAQDFMKSRNISNWSPRIVPA